MAAILAAGESTRLGQPKQLLQFHGKTLLRRAVDARAKSFSGGKQIATQSRQLFLLPALPRNN